MGGPLRALDADIDNLRSGFDWCELTDPVAGLRLAAATGYLWLRRSAAEGRRWANLLLARCQEPSLARAGALHAAGMLQLFSDPVRARCLEQDAYGLAEQLSDHATSAIARAGAGYALILQEQALAAIPELEYSVALAERVGDARGIAWISSMLSIALLSDHTRRDEGRRNLERALSMSLAAGEDGDKAMPSFAHFILGLNWRWSGKPAHALEHFRSALELMRELELVPNLSSVLLQVARLLATSDPERSAELAGAASPSPSGLVFVFHRATAAPLTGCARTCGDAWAQRLRKARGRREANSPRVKQWISP
jgi:hypothetical protein